MRHYIILPFVATLMVAIMAIGCGGSTSKTLEHLDNKVYSPSHASGFEVLGAEGSASTLLRITRPWQGDDVESYELLILRNGESAPVDFSGAVIDSAARRIVALSSSNVAMFERLGQVDRIVGVSGLDYFSSSLVAERAAEHELYDVGYDNSLNYELLTMLKPDIVLLYSVAGANSSVTSKLDELSIPYLYIGDYAEESPLGKAEWMVAMGEICGSRELAEELFAQSVKQYNNIVDHVKRSTDASPKIMLNTPYRDIWYMPSSNSYMVRLIEDAGAEYIYEGNSSLGTKPISVEEAYKLSTTADFWLNTGAMINSMATLRSQVPKFADMPAVKSGKVYNSTARTTPLGGSDFWESGVVHPEIVLADLVEIFHPSILEHELYYYKKLE